MSYIIIQNLFPKTDPLNAYAYPDTLLASAISHNHSFVRDISVWIFFSAPRSRRPPPGKNARYSITARRANVTLAAVAG